MDYTTLFSNPFICTYLGDSPCTNKVFRLIVIISNWITIGDCSIMISTFILSGREARY